MDCRERRKSMTENNGISASIQVLDKTTVEDIQKSIQKALDDNKPRFANVAVANFDGSIAYTLTKKVGGRA